MLAAYNNFILIKNIFYITEANKRSIAIFLGNTLSRLLFTNNKEQAPVALDVV